MSGISRKPIVPLQQAYTMPNSGGVPSLGIQPQDLGLRVQFEPKEKSEINIDVVTVHGLGVRPQDTWIHGQTGVNWLRTEGMLPQALPKARIMTFGYDSSWFGVTPVRQSIDMTAEGLLNQLHQARVDSPNRPVIFIGHCFGGLVIQKVYIATTTPSNPWTNITSIAGIVFLGTPHFGASDSFFGPKPPGQFYDAIMQLNMQSYDQSLHRMAEGSNDLRAVVDGFLQTVQKAKTPPELFSFFEQRSTKAGMMDLTVNEVCGVLAGGGKAGLLLDHTWINKFPSPMDTQYQTVAQVLMEMAKKAEKYIKVAAPKKEHAAEKRLLFGKRTDFAPRDDILRRIEIEFVESVSVVLYGKSGHGKTQVAVHYMHKFHEEHPKAGVFWVFANTAVEFEHSYKRIAKSLKIPKETVKADGLLASVQNHLNQDSSGNWLMVVDGANADDKLMATEAKFAGKPLLGFIPNAALNGKVIITTRSKKLAKHVLKEKAEDMIRVDTLGRKDASVVLLGKQTKDEKKKEFVKATWKRMEGSACLLAMYTTYQKKLSKESQGKIQPPPEGTSVAQEQWQLLYSMVQLQHPGLLDFMLIVSFLEVQYIPRAFFQQKQLDSEIPLLIEYGIIEPTVSGMAFSITPLIQSCAQTWLDVNKTTEASLEGRVIDILSTQLTKETSEELLSIVMLAAQFESVTQGKIGVDLTRKLSGIFFLAAEYYARSGQLADAEGFFKRCMELREQDPDKSQEKFQALLGETRQALQKSQSNLLRRQSTLSRKKSTRVPRNPLVSKTDNVDGKGKEFVKDPAKEPTKENPLKKKMTEARKKLQELEANDSRWEHHSTVQTASYLAKLCVTYEVTVVKSEQANVQATAAVADSEAVNLYRRIVRWCETSKTAPKDFKARSQYSLAIALDTQGRFREAMELYIAARRFFQGLQKPGEWDREAEVMELRILNNLSCNYCAQGNLTTGEETFKVVLHRQTEILGPNHPDTLVTRQNMGLMMQQQVGRMEGATEELHRVLEAQTSLLGAQHQATMRTTCSVALNQRLKGQLAESEALYNSTLKAQTKVLGENHCDTSLTKVMLGELQKQVALK